jgi:TonB family protein
MGTYFTSRNLFFTGLSFLLHLIILILIYNYSFKNRLPPFKREAIEFVYADIKKDVQVSQQISETKNVSPGRKEKSDVKEITPEIPEPPVASPEPQKQTPEIESTVPAELSPVAASDSALSISSLKADAQNTKISGKSSDQGTQADLTDAASNLKKVEKIYAPLPSFPERAADLGESGIFEILIRIDTTGSVSDIKILSAKVSDNSTLLKSIFTDEIFRTVRKWKFKPVKLNNKLTSVPVILPIEFNQESSDYN